MADDTVIDRPPPLDLLGTATGTVAIGDATFVIVQGRAWGWFDARIITVFINHPGSTSLEPMAPSWR